MSMELKIKKGKYYPLGVTLSGSTLNIVYELHAIKECGMILYPVKQGEEIKIKFTDQYKTGDLYCIEITGVPFREYHYSFYEDDRIVPDYYAKSLADKMPWGKENKEYHFSFYQDKFSWEDDKNPEIPYEDSILYGLHVRGFTKHVSSECKYKGTFHGILEKIPYLKEIGITAIVTLPIYEFDECDQKSYQKTQYMNKRYMDHTELPQMINYWGYKDALYMIPKSAYSSKKDSVNEVKTLIRELHRQNMEFIMQVYFPEQTRAGYIMDVLRYWVSEYHVDGFELKGSILPINDITTDPLLKKMKLLYEGFDLNHIYQGSQVPTYRNLGIFNEEYMNGSRAFLKGDNDTIRTAFDLMRKNPERCGIINYITDYNTMTLMDMVMYDRKHNEKNGENNEDGKDYNYSWNCGKEGPSKKKIIQELRLKMRKNAMALLMTSLGTPYIMAGDEFGNTQYGNNNPYCQDNEISYLNWNQMNVDSEFHSFVREMILFRISHLHFHRKRECTLMDSLGCGYPDLSVHSDEAWRAKLENYNHTMGLMYCGKYVHEEMDLYIAYNMDWQNKEFALPTLNEGKKWFCVGDTSLNASFHKEIPIEKGKIICQARSIQILVGHHETKKD